LECCGQYILCTQQFTIRPRISTRNDVFWMANRLRKRAIDGNRLLRPSKRFSGQVCRNAPVVDSVRRFSLQVMVWGCISYDTKLPLVVWPAGENVTARTYSQRVLGDTVHPFLDANDPERRRYWLQEDGSPVHWARWSQETKDACDIPSLEPREWPAMSPDLAPLDYYVWGWMTKEVSFRSCFLLCLIPFSFAGVPRRSAGDFGRINCAHSSSVGKYASSHHPACYRRSSSSIPNV
jgi:hypothetical protein